MEWIKKYNVPGSNSAVWTVGIDKDGNYGCSCPVWKFKRQECKHIKSVKDNVFLAEENKSAEPFRTAQPGNVGEVTIKDNIVLYPLVPLGWPYTAHLICTIIYDMARANVDPFVIMDYKRRMLEGDVSIKRIREFVETNGRLVYTKCEKGRGWVNPVAVPHDMKLRRAKQ